MRYFTEDLTEPHVLAPDGTMPVPQGPGIGLELIEEVAAAHPGRSPAPHLRSAQDGGLLDW